MPSPAPGADLADLLDDYLARHPEEGATALVFNELLDSAGPAAFGRDHFEPGHVTGSAWVVDGSGARTLLTHHAKLDRWLQLGGHCDGDPDVASAAVREAEEESGLGGFEFVMPGIFDLDVHPIPERPGQPAHLHYDVRFALRYPGDQAFTVSDESHDLAWVEVGDIRSFTTEPSMLRMAQKWVSRPPAP